MTNDVDSGIENLIAVGVVEMKMSIDDRTHRLVGDALQLIEQHPRGSGRNVIVHDRHVVVVHDDGGIANYRKRPRSDRVIDALFHFVEPERVPIVSRAGRYTLRLRRSGFTGGGLNKQYRDNDQTADENQCEPGHAFLLPVIVSHLVFRDSAQLETRTESWWYDVAP